MHIQTKIYEVCRGKSYTIEKKDGCCERYATKLKHFVKLWKEECKLDQVFKHDSNL